MTYAPKLARADHPTRRRLLQAAGLAAGGALLAPGLAHAQADWRVPLESILERGGFDLDRIVALEPHFLHDHALHDEAPGHVHDEHCGHDHGHRHDHDGRGGHVHDHVSEAGIASVCLELHEPVDGQAFSAWLQDVVARDGPRILRLKGIVDVQGEPRRLVVQGVHMLLEGEPQRPWGPREARCTRLVFIRPRPRRAGAARRAAPLRRPLTQSACARSAGYHQFTMH